MSTVARVVTPDRDHRGKARFLMALSALCGAAFFIQAVPVLENYRAPVVDGTVVARKAVRVHEILPRADFTIQIDGEDVEVHAITGRYLLDRIPDKVRFHYSGDATRVVFLFDYEQNPIWMCLLCWGIAVACVWRPRFFGRAPPRSTGN